MFKSIQEQFSIKIIPRLFTVHTDEELGVTVKDRLNATVCKDCPRLSIPHLTLDHERLALDKRKLFAALQEKKC